MKYDVFFSICQTEVDGIIPSERTMFQNFFDQVRHADTLGYEIAWIAESHLSCEVQKENPGAVIPNFKGEIGLNTDVLQIAHRIFAATQKIQVGSAIRSILCNGGPIAHAEAVKSFLALHSLDSKEQRLLHLGFAAGRFPFSSAPYGIVPRNAVEKAAWPVVKGKIFSEATEIFLRLLRGDVFSSREVTRQTLSRADFRDDLSWQNVISAANQINPSQPILDSIPLASRWEFDRLGVVPQQVSLELLRLVIGSHDPATQEFANTLLPCGVFNLSITPFEQIENTHTRMQKSYHPLGGKWQRSHMPRTVLVFLNADKRLSPQQQRELARTHADKALSAYWSALEGTIDPKRIDQAVNNALVGNPHDIAAQMKERFHADDRLMLWFDFFNHDNAAVQQSMTNFMEHVAPLV